jgi:hypothetical protein
VTKPGRTHIFWQRRIREGDTETPYWFPSETSGGALKENRLVLLAGRGRIDACGAARALGRSPPACEMPTDDAQLPAAAAFPAAEPTTLTR